MASSTGSAEPRLNERTEVLAKFVSSRAFDRLPYEKQRQYYKVLDDRDKQIDQAFNNGQLSESQYRTALEAAWLGKHINRVEKYMSLPPGNARAQYINQLLDKKAKKDSRQSNQDDSNNRISVDETAAELRVESWPAEVRAQWKLFHDAYRQEKKLRERAATNPATP